MSESCRRSGRLSLMAAVVLLGLVVTDCTAMVYRPSVGRFKDGFICWHKGQFYLFSMYTLGDEAGFRNVWLATSTDGVHWNHVGPVIKDAPVQHLGHGRPSSRRQVHHEPRQLLAARRAECHPVLGVDGLGALDVHGA